MSLINKMLQDLDARGTPGADAFPSNVRPVAPERQTPSLRLLGAGAGIALFAVGGVALACYAWTHLHPASAGRGASAAALIKPAAPVPAHALQGTIAPAPAASGAQAVKIAPPGAVEPQSAAAGAAPSPTPAPAPVPSQQDAVADDAPSAPTHAGAPRNEGQAAAHAGARTDVRGGEAVPAAHATSVLPTEPDSLDAREARRAAAIELATRGARMTRLARLLAQQASAPEVKAAVKGSAKAAAKAVTLAKTNSKLDAEGRQAAPPQRAEDDYRRALASLQDGRTLDAIAALQLALRADPGHDAARQTLVGLLVESGRTDDAMRELQLGLAQDPRQPALAMLLARLQIERGGSGIETLMRTLPYAGNNTVEGAEYHGFLAGALQRQQRHREAADQYQQALRAAPGNGVWWMGLGLSLQADKRNAEALDAFQRAAASGSLNAELQAFVERRIQQLVR